MAFFKKRWSVPSKRAKGYAEERKAKVHKWGQKEGKELTDFIKSITVTKTVDECIGICKNRSIFSEIEIRELHSKYPKVISLLDYAIFVNKVTLNQLYETCIIAKDSGPRPFNIINKEQFDTIYKLGMEAEE